MAPKPQPEPKLPYIVTLLRKAMRWQGELATGKIESRAAIARRERISRARVTQIMHLLRLPEDTQERVLAMELTASRPWMSERRARRERWQGIAGNDDVAYPWEE